MNIQSKSITTLVILSTLFIPITYACSRFTYTAPENTVVVGRSMDWMEDIHTDLWAFPAGIKRTGSAGTNSATWTSKYGSVVASGYNVGVADGINTMGLDVNLLYLASSKYATTTANSKNLSILMWAQYVLDNYATVDEAVTGLQKNPLTIIAPALPNGSPAALHLAMTDPTGDNAIFEYIKGKLVIHHGKQFKVMTNEPTYDKQLALNDYWQNLKGAFLPGTDEPADRFVRASYYLQNAIQTSDIQKSIATVFSILRNVSAPFGKSTTDRPNVAPTIWRTVADLKHKVYYFEASDRPNVFWVNLNKLNLSSGAPIMKLSLANNQFYAGETSKNFTVSAPFKFAEVSPTQK